MTQQPFDPATLTAGFEQTATEMELQAAIKVFTAECLRADSVRLGRATEAAHAALQAHLDAIAGTYAVTKRALGIP